LAGGVYPDMPFNQQMSVPTSLTLHNSGGQFRLHRNPVVEIESLYAGLQEWKDLDIKPGENPLQKIQGDLFDISLEASWQEPSSVASSFGFRIRGVEIRFDCSNHTLSCMGRSVKMTDDKNSIKIRVLVDRTSIELFIDDGLICMSFCFTPSPANYSLEFFCDSLPVHIETLSLHILRSAWSNDSASAE
jgi:sucrose-6-phosphate hydrolase SacC (GH32 family)